MTPTHSRRRPHVTWSAKSATVTYEAVLNSRPAKVRQALLDGDWTFVEPSKPRKGRKSSPKRSHLHQDARKPSRKR